MNRFLEGAQGFFQRYTICAVLNVLVLKKDKKGMMIMKITSIRVFAAI